MASLVEVTYKSKHEDQWPQYAVQLWLFHVALLCGDCTRVKAGNGGNERKYETDKDNDGTDELESCRLLTKEDQPVKVKDFAS